MGRDEVIALAERFLRARVGSSPQLEGEACEYRLLGAQLEEDGTWSVVYQIHVPGPPLSVVDGPVVVIVEPSTRQASFLDERSTSA
ncbi:Hypothetical protein A7982_06811 [Minicystis rosea]|nr:Hypothetical protein A7982_06811 [Minicystis rosea]